MKINKIYILLFSSLLAITVCGLISTRNIRQKKESMQSVIQTHELLEHTLDLLSTLKDAETGQRGYLLTKDDRYLESYTQAAAQIDKKLHALTTLIQDNSRQQAIAQKLEPLVEVKADLMHETIRLMEKGEADSAMAILETDIGLTTMNQIRVIGQEIMADQQGMIREKAGLLDKLHIFGATALYANLLFISLIVVGAMYTIRRKSRENNRLIHRLEEQNQQLEDEVEKRTQEIKRKNEALQHVNKEKNRFMGITAHDLRSPLSAINGFCYLFRMKGENLDEEQKKWIEHIENTSDRMSYLISNLMDVSRIEEGRLAIHPELIDVQVVLQEALEGYQKIGARKGTSVQLSAETMHLPLMTDKHHLLQVVDNLVSNAIKFSAAGSSVYIHTLRTQDKVLIEVRDEGPGIEPDELCLLFKKFQKLSNAPTAGEGSTGLGLYITKEMVSLLQGEVHCESEKGQGTKFMVSLPVVFNFETQTAGDQELV